MSPQRVLTLAWIIWAVSWWAAACWTAPTAVRAPARSQLSYRVILGAGLVLLFGFPRTPSFILLWRLPQAWLWICSGAAIAGFAFCWWARLHLGRLWSAHVVRKDGHTVIDTGPYRLVRHPIYTGIILASIATVGEKGTLVALLGAAVMTLSWYVKARLEERLLRAELGAAYDVYAARVPMLVPFTKF